MDWIDAEVEAPLTLRVNGVPHSVRIDTRTTLLDALRERFGLTGTKKGCDHGQCGACTVLVNGRRINSCLSLAMMHADDEITTIEGVGAPGALHPLQTAFIDAEGFQCGYCTSGQICSALGMLEEVAAGWPSHVSGDLMPAPPLDLGEIRERMSGNLCRCAAYPRIVAAIQSYAASREGEGA
jgi:xanthine dehydrogenase YagT iron-sulfur-binding subunit